MGLRSYQVSGGRLSVEAVDLDVAGPELSGGRGQRRRRHVAGLRPGVDLMNQFRP
jgi:hypothetical protein